MVPLVKCIKPTTTLNQTKPRKWLFRRMNIMYDSIHPIYSSSKVQKTTIFASCERFLFVCLPLNFIFIAHFLRHVNQIFFWLHSTRGCNAICFFFSLLDLSAKIIIYYLYGKQWQLHVRGDVRWLCFSFTSFYCILLLWLWVTEWESFFVRPFLLHVPSPIQITKFINSFRRNNKWTSERERKWKRTLHQYFHVLYDYGSIIRCLWRFWCSPSSCGSHDVNEHVMNQRLWWWFQSNRKNTRTQKRILRLNGISQLKLWKK